MDDEKPCVKCGAIGRLKEDCSIPGCPEQRSFIRAWWDDLMGNNDRLDKFLRRLCVIVISIVAACLHGWDWIVYVWLGYVVLESMLMS